MDLYPYQLPHYECMKEILSYSHCVIDSSPMGRGKSIVALHYAKEHGLDVFICCDAIMKEKFQRLLDEFELDGVIMSYSNLRGVIRDGEITVNHDFLIAEDGKYHATEDLIEMIEYGTLFIFDEFQALKNPSKQHHAAKEIVWTVALHRGDGNSRVLYLSETGIDKKDSIGRVYNLLCLSTNQLIYHPEYSIHDDIIERVYELEPEALTGLPIPANRNEAIDNLFNLYIKVFKHYYSCSMPQPDSSVAISIHNCFYYVPDEEAQVIALRVSELITRVSIRADGTAHLIPKKGGKNTLRFIEEAKVPLFARLTRQSLENTNKKIILMLNHVKPIEMLAEELEEYDPLVITGDTPMDDRSEFIEWFQEDNDDYRLIIFGRVGRAGIDLDDTVGDRPRRTFISPGDSFDPTYQGIGRTYRANTKSDVEVVMVHAYNEAYGSTMTKELRILKALSTKQEVVRDFSLIQRTDINLASCPTIFEDGTPFDEEQIIG